MFRKPRETASTSVLLPSLGRPPTPPPVAHHLDDHMAAKTRTPTMVSRTQLPTPRATPTPVPGRARVVKAGAVAKLSAAKTGTKTNGNILSFFRKVEAGKPLDEDLFFEDTIGDLAGHTKVVPARGDENGHAPEDWTSAEVGSVDEAPRPEKRRRMVESSPDGNDLWGDWEKREQMQSTGLETSSGRLMEAVDGPAHGSVDMVATDSGEHDVQVPPSRSGPFYQDDGDPQLPELPRFDQAATDEPPSNDTASNGTRTGDGNDDLHGDSARPPLLRESTSIAGGDGFDGFDGFEDFDDCPEDGEEHLERRWMEQHEELHGALEDEVDEDLIPDRSMEEALTEAAAESDPGSPTPCPVCSVSLAGMTDEQASIHVNHCLDGHPPPPSVVPSAQEPSPTKIQPHKRFQRAAIARPGQANPLLLATSSPASAFSQLMANHTEDAAWAQAADHEAKSRGQPAYKRVCPFYKIMPGLSICVDAFRYGKVDGCHAYFLSHFHSDHYIGLTASWCHGPIYCSRVTGNLVRQQLRVDPQWVVDLEFEVKTPVPGTGGVDITMIPANHCPGSSLFLFEKPLSPSSPKIHRILHCGDFRACRAHIEHPLLRPDVVDVVQGKTRQQKIDVCYLDTTYLTPKYAFPSQEEVIQACADMCVSLSKEIVDPADPFELAKLERAGKSMVRFIRKESSLLENGDADSMGGTGAPAVESKDGSTAINNGDETTAVKSEDGTTAVTSEGGKTAIKSEEEMTAINMEYGRTTIKSEEEGSKRAVSIDNSPIAAPPHIDSTTTLQRPRSRGRLLVVIGTYSIGKERICLGIARALHSLIYAPPAKQRICAALEDPELSALLTTDPLAAQVHMQPLMEIRAETLADYLTPFRPAFARVVGFRPSGWSYRPPGSRGAEPRVRDVLFAPAWRSGFGAADLVPGRGSCRQAACYGVPYSEHSSFRELTMFVCALRIGRVVPTVNVGSRKRREEMRTWVERWERERRTSGLFRLDDGGGGGGGSGGGGQW